MLSSAKFVVVASKHQGMDKVAASACNSISSESVLFHFPVRKVCCLAFCPAGARVSFCSPQECISRCSLFSLWVAPTGVTHSVFVARFFVENALLEAIPPFGIMTYMILLLKFCQMFMLMCALKHIAATLRGVTDLRMQLQTQKMAHLWISWQLGFGAVASKNLILMLRYSTPMLPVIGVHRLLHI